MSDYVTLKEISDRIGLDRSNTRKWLKAQGFDFVQVRDLDSRQLVNALTIEDAERAVTLRLERGFDCQRSAAATVLVANEGVGYFYAMRLMPDVAPNRIKLGFASTLQTRLDAHRTTCPRLEVVKTWPCQKVYEPAAIAAAVNGTSDLYGGEVYDVKSVDALVERLDLFFGLLS